jgi:hypothetical protein
MEVQMGLSRKRKKELKHLRESAEELWGQQQALIEQANSVAREASRQANHYAREQVAPAVREGFETYVRPGMRVTGRLAGGARDRVIEELIPTVGSIIGTALTVVDHAKDARERAFAQQLDPHRIGKALSKRTAAAERAIGRKADSSGVGAGAYVALGIGLVAAIGVAYAVWQTFRADDELWVSDDLAPEPPQASAETDSDDDSASQ